VHCDDPVSAMRLFLCSSSVRGAVAELADVLAGGRRVAVTANALDTVPDMRRDWLAAELSALASARVDPFELDLRDYYGSPAGALAGALSEVDMVWATGGSVFVLIDAMRRSGFDEVLRTRLREDTLAYGGCSAGACVCAPSLRGFEVIENEMPEGGPSFAGLGLIAFSIVPHHGSPGAVGATIDRLLTALSADGIPYRTLSDGQALVVRGDEIVTVTMHEDGS
jgi:dipeptidase E